MSAVNQLRSLSSLDAKKNLYLSGTFIKKNASGSAIFNVDDTGTTISTPLYVNSTATFNSSVLIQSDLTASAVSASALSVNGASTLNTLTVNGQTTINSGLTVSGDLTVNAGATFSGQLVVTGSLNITNDLTSSGNVKVNGVVSGSQLNAATLLVSGSNALTNIGTGLLTNSRYNIKTVLEAIDSKIASDTAAINTNYNNMRYVASASFAGGNVPGIFNPEEGRLQFIIPTSKFNGSDIDKVALDVMVNPHDLGYYTNDLVSVSMSVNGSNQIVVTVEAGLTNASDFCKVVAVKESGNIL